MTAFTMTTSEKIIDLTDHLGARNYKPGRIVVQQGKGARVWDPEGNMYYDMLSAYSANNFGHCHPEIVAAAKAQLDLVTLISRAFYSENLGLFYDKLCTLTGKAKILPMNTGAEAVETALKAARLWGNKVKGIANGRQEIIACKGNFHGRTISILSFSNDETARDGYGPYTPGFSLVDYGDADALEAAITENTVAFLVEPIQGEAGVIVPPEGYLTRVREICTANNVLMIADEVQTGFARTGDLFACGHEGVEPDLYVLGKALGGGIMPVSAVAANADVLGLFTPGSHGSTFGGNPLAAAVAIAAMDILVEENYAQMAREKGAYLINRLKSIEHSDIVAVRGRGLMVGVDFSRDAAPYVDKLARHGILAKETHQRTIRLAPAVNIPDDQLEDACDRIEAALKKK